MQEVQNGSSIEDRSPIESTVENSPLAAEEASSTDEGLVNQTVRFNWKIWFNRCKLSLIDSFQLDTNKINNYNTPRIFKIKLF